MKNRDTSEVERKTIAVCGGTGCQGSEADKVIAAFRREIKNRQIEDQIDFKITGCPGFCEQGPLAVVRPQDIFYVKISPEKVPEIIEKSILDNQIIDELLYRENEEAEEIIKEKEVPFYKHQKRIVFENNGLIDPASIEDYIEKDGYSALSKILSGFEPQDVISEIKNSGLRGRGGAGFPTGQKWEFASREKSDIKYVVCNADEGDPGAFMDRGLLEGNPHLVIEGMIIGAYAIGANQGYIYCRTEYPLAVENAQKAIEDSRRYGFLGDNIFNSGFSFDLEIRKGAGAFVAGEETALLHSIEGKRAMPTQRPPYPATSGLWGKPTNINNVETWANVPYIINRGSDWFSEIGTENSKGTKVFSLVGKINNTGLIEVPMGITLREIIYEIGGGIPEGKEFKAVQTGGPSGGCIPADYLDLQVDYEKLSEANSMMGSGGMVVMDEDTCMVDVAKYFLEFLQEESCGKCPPCRVGVPKMLKILERITAGEGRKGDLETLEELGKTISNASLCGLGQTSANPVLSTLEHFRNEYEEHIFDKKCSALVCPDLLHYEIDEELCKGCDQCKQVCPVEAIQGTPGDPPYHINNEDCIRCGSCIEECNFDAIQKRPGTGENV
ncbi:MAG: NADH-quinone oxidoreductase subunit NuoF [Bacillota bacterium]